MAGNKAVRYRQSWLFCSVFLGLTGGFVAVIVYSAVTRFLNGQMAWDGFIWPLIFSLFPIGFIRTGVLGSEIEGSELHIPHAFRPSTRIALADIAGIYLARKQVSAYGQHGWGPVIWTQEHSFVYIQALTSLSDSVDPGHLLESHVGRTVSDMYRRVRSVQGDTGPIATQNVPLTYGTPISILINPRDFEKVPSSLEAADRGRNVWIYRPHDTWAAIRGLLGVVALVIFSAGLITTAVNNAGSLLFGLYTAGVLVTGTIAWHSLRNFLHHTTITQHTLHIRSGLKDAIIPMSDVAGIGLISLPWRNSWATRRWVPVVWTASSMHAIPNVVSYEKDDIDAESLLMTRAGSVAQDIIRRVAGSQGLTGPIHGGLGPPSHRELRTVQLSPDGHPLPDTLSMGHG